MSMKSLSFLLLLQLTCYFSSGFCGKVLVWPVEFSHWMNMKAVLDELVMRGHEVTVLISSASTITDANKPSAFKFEIFPVSLTKDDFENAVKNLIEKWTYMAKNSFWTNVSSLRELKSLLWEFSGMLMKMCKEVVSKKKLITKLQESRFDVLLADAAGPCGRPTTFLETIGKADMWLIRTYWDFEFPRPVLPNFEFVGGLHCKPAKPLPKEMEEFVQSSGENGIVVFTLGSMISNITEEKANVIASALAQIPQKVLWRYDGKKPDTLGPNTRLYKWIPQNDLLGHPKTKAFITHGGTNGIYEAIYHGIPMVGLPLFADQPDNIVRVKAKGAAVRVDLETMSSRDLLNALKEVINNPSYKEKAMWLSTIQRNQPIKPLDRAVFWIEFVMRHKGAKHLRPASHNLTWFQYHSLDVIGFLLACVATVVFVTTKCFLFCYRKFAKTGKKQKRE
ncbi:UDP-glucuronosyltransferase 2B17-like isoform X3 [Bubalus kerabau]|uniref:UDP-glucuronosyltransferase 2B17-like isoform X3 n=1 Tax=Bubalus carabanensis TaxID=3119969 RepID=UPI00244E64DC|nr:UDP-glucuronosyltransferase 2B17-like isoform X3 [Bubalus carabanensis]